MAKHLADNLYPESWIEVSSQPSSSSLSSVGEEIVTTGLRVQYDSIARRRRRLRRHATEEPRSSSTQSQYDDSVEEYESEPDSDRVLASSNEALQPSPLQNEWQPPGRQSTLSSASSDNAFTSAGEEDDENATAIGITKDEPLFTPQPNAFTHRPTSHPGRGQEQSMNSYFTPRPSRTSAQRHSYPDRQQHAPYNMISPSYQADHDAALRASLSTLLSCAAAARGLSKKENTETRTRPGPSNRIDAATIGLVPESAVFGDSRPSSTATSPPLSTNATSVDKAKRKASAPIASTQRSSSKERRMSKKVRRTSNWTPATMDEVSPTLFTWVVSAGVVVLVSALSFSAGYVTGKEAGHAEALNDLREAGSCGRDAMIDGAGRGLRRLRWTDAANSIRV